MKTEVSTFKNPYWIKEAYFRQESYAVWAAREILSLMQNANKPTISVLQDFIEKMDAFSCKNMCSSLGFSVAKDVAEDIMFMMLGKHMERRNQ